MIEVRQTDRAYRQGRLVMDSKQDLVDEIERLRTALKRIDNESDCDHAAKIAQDALADEQSGEKS